MRNLIALCILLIAQAAFGQTIDESSGRKYRPGDVINMTAETKKVIRLYSAGTPQHPITLNAMGMVLKDTYIEFMSGANYWVVNGLTMKGGPRLLDAYKADGLTLQNCTFGPIADGGSYCVRIHTSNNIAVRYCTFVGFDSIWRSPLGVKGDGLVLDNCNDGQITGNTFGDCGHVALNVRNSARNLIIWNTVANHLHTGISILNIPGNPGASFDNIVSNNVVKFMNKRPSDKETPGIGIELLHVSGNAVRYNTIYDGRSTGITLASNESNAAKGNVIEYNTLYKTGERGIEIGMFGTISADTVTGNTIRNNIIVGNWANTNRGAGIVLVFKDWTTTGNSIARNFLSPSAVKLRQSIGDILLNTQGLDILTGDPKFVWAGRDFHLRSGSPAVGMGAYP